MTIVSTCCPFGLSNVTKCINFVQIKEAKTMVKYNFKKITVVPNGKQFVDIVLSRTQRQTPTVVHKGDRICKLRSFYMRKVKFTESNFNEKLSAIIDEFPRLKEIQPFYEDLLHVLYNKDHYKLALGQVNTAKNKISKIAMDYVKLLKHGDSLYRCKCLKVAALGRMCTVMKGIGPSLAYLEQVRQHIARLPSIDPNTRTLLICGCPNVGKSSFMNKVTRADVAVQPYAFTTKSLFLGHTDYKCLRYQVIDTPGLLDREIEDRNIIELCSITALAHIRAAVLFFLDISGSCGYTIAQQASLFHNIKSVFKNKPLVIVCNKTDLMPMENLSEEDRKLIEEMKDEAMKTEMGASEEAVILEMSTLTEEGVMFHVAMPKSRDDQERLPCIPQVAGEKEKRKTEKDLEDENGGAGVYSASLKKNYILAKEEWKDDIIPEICDCHNVADFVDSDILNRLEELTSEESLRKAEEEEVGFEIEGEELTEKEKNDLAAIRKKKALLIEESRLKKSNAQNRAAVPRKFDKDKKFTRKRMGRELSSLGLDPSSALNRARSKSRGRKRERYDDLSNDAMDVDVNDDEQHKKKKMCLRSKSRSLSRSRSVSRPPHEVVPGEGFKDSSQKIKAIKIGHKSHRKRDKAARRGEADRVIPSLKPKHLFSGKRGNGKNQRR
ncbi:P-loop containing nucleoside triphosphate hydrolase [Arabidopsis thaliana x Arabidopsis arenosa]|uniref:Nucleolar GTP-binding protein 1 n=1 Tax=Arabidopsis thaliana x Arabidopsis arenosa TaxID=1240361 RepID=A0A8T2GAY7_9BRAS|nr:P-loop containing nucleoside triphosphate hydrolase [Arabidopsis thaliana x Arabidopsis arenosa]